MLTLTLPANTPSHGICCVNGKLCEYEMNATILRSRRLDGTRAWDAWKILNTTQLLNNLVLYSCSKDGGTNGD
jgi:hypothetical protein